VTLKIHRAAGRGLQAWGLRCGSELVLAAQAQSRLCHRHLPPSPRRLRRPLPGRAAALQLAD